MSSKRNSDEELLWRAFCYVHGELSDDEAQSCDFHDHEMQAFEAQLDADQALREAVAKAVELTELAGAALTPQRRAPLQCGNSRGGLDWSRPALWIALATAACLAIFTWTWSWTHRSVPSPRQVVDTTHGQKSSGVDHAATELAATELAVTELAEVWAGALADEQVADDVMSSGAADEIDIGEVDPDDDGALVVSDWLFEALTARANDVGDGDAPSELNHEET
jgi:hypothetical protein